MKMLTTWAPTELGPLQLAYSRWVRSRVFCRLSCSTNGRMASYQEINLPASGGCPTFPLVTRTLDAKIAPDWDEIGRLTPAGNRSNVSWWLWAASASCFRLLLHFIRLAASRIFCTAG